MDNFVYELGQAYLEETLARDFVFPDGEEAKIEMWRFHWVLYDRYAERYPDKFEDLILNGLQRDTNWNPALYSAFLSRQLVRDAKWLVKNGEDPLEDGTARLLRRSRIWKFRQSARGKASSSTGRP